MRRQGACFFDFAGGYDGEGGGPFQAFEPNPGVCDLAATQILTQEAHRVSSADPQELAEVARLMRGSGGGR